MTQAITIATQVMQMLNTDLTSFNTISVGIKLRLINKSYTISRIILLYPSTVHTGGWGGGKQHSLQIWVFIY